MCNVSFINEHLAITQYIKSHDVSVQEIAVMFALFSIANDRKFPEDAMSIKLSEIGLFTADLPTRTIKNVLASLEEKGLLVCAESERKPHRSAPTCVEITLRYLSVKQAEQGRNEGVKQAEQGRNEGGTRANSHQTPQVRPYNAPISAGGKGGNNIIYNINNQDKSKADKSRADKSSVEKNRRRREDERVDGVGDFFPQPFMTDEDATTIQQDHDAILDAAENAGFPQNQATFDLLIRLYAEHGTEAVLFGIEQCVKQGKSKPSYLEAVIRNRGKPKPTEATDAIYFPEGGESFG